MLTLTRVKIAAGVGTSRAMGASAEFAWQVALRLARRVGALSPRVRPRRRYRAESRCGYHRTLPQASEYVHR